MTFWMNDEFRENEKAVSIADRGFLLGDGVFETILVDRGTPAFLDAHMARLQSGLAALGIDARLPDTGSIIRALAERKSLADGLASARLTVSRGVSARGLAFPDAARPSMLLTLAGAFPPGEAPLRLAVSKFARAETGIAARCKTLNYLDNILAKNEALQAGADDAVMLNSHGRIACASAANIFVIDGDGAATSPIEEGALPGIVRGLLLKGASDAGVSVAERVITVDELRSGAVFLTNSLMGLRAARLEDRADANVAQTEMFKNLEAWYQARLCEDLEMRRAAL